MDASSIGTNKKQRGKVPKRSKIWEVFTILEEDPCKATCLKCHNVVSRGGGTAKSQCTTNLWNHLKNKHIDVFEEISKYKELVHRTTADRASLSKSVLEYDCLNKSKVWELFSIDSKDYSVAKCIECNETINGGTESGTDPLWCHVMVNHPATYSRCVSEAVESVVLCTKGKRSAVWSEFTQHPLNICKVICNTCDTIVSRGTSKDRLNTTNMRRHLSGSHHQTAIRSKENQVRQNVEGADSEQTQNGILTMRDCLLEHAKELAERSPESHNSDDVYDETSHIPKNENEVSSNFPQIGDADTIMKKRTVDMVHTALVMDALYEQQKLGICCDFSLFVRHDIPVSLYNRHEKDIMNVGIDQKTEYETEFKFHSCVAATVSEKLRTVIESACDRLTIKDVNKSTVLAFIQIAYTGKLTEINELKKKELMQIHDLASLLSTTPVTEYLERSYPKQKFVVPNLNTTMRNKKLHAPLYNLNTNNTCSPKCSIVNDFPVSPEAIKVHETDGLIGYSTIPKINKRKNYMPMANESSRKKSRRDCELNDASTEVSTESGTDSEQLSPPAKPDVPYSVKRSNPELRTCKTELSSQSHLPTFLTINNDNNYEKPKVLESPTICSKSSPSNCPSDNVMEHLAERAEANQHSPS